MLVKLKPDNWYSHELKNIPYGWIGERSYANNIGFEKHFQMYNDMVDWLHANVENTDQNAHWTKIGDCIYVQFRKEKDLLLFILRWGN